MTDAMPDIVAMAQGIFPNCTPSSVALFAGLIGLVSFLWGLWLQAKLRNFTHRAKMDLAAADLTRSFKKALLTGAAEGAVVLKVRGREQQYYGEGKALYESCLASPKSGNVTRAVASLIEAGTPFALSVPCGHCDLILRGVPVAGRAVLYFHIACTSEPRIRYCQILHAHPVPVWMRGAENSIVWANKAFVSIAGFSSLEDAVAGDAMLPRSERELAVKALQSGEPASGRVSVIVRGESRVFSLGLAPMPVSGVAGFASDVTENAQLISRLRLACDAQDDVIDHFPFAVAVLDGERRLAGCNKAYADLWDLPKPWLDSHPSYGEILDRLRDKRRLPERRNFPEWKAAQLAAFDPAGRRSEEFWHLPNGRSIRIASTPSRASPHVRGITERLKLESSLNLLTQVQKATLDTLDEGIAIFGTDGRLVMHNVPFARMWKLTESELDGQPHFAEIANNCTDRIGHDGIWGIVSCGVNSATPERFGEWSKTKRADGRTISLSLSRLPNGTTVVAFTDITDLEQFSALAEDMSHAVA
jgi:PAS domain-containing protein